jgi:hypothetical protein
MPGTMYLDQAATFAAPPICLMAAVKTKFGTGEPDISKNGERRYVVQVAVTYRAENGMPVQSEVLQVTVTGDDPTGIPAGSPVEFDGLRCGFTTPETRPDGRVRGGKPFFGANAVRVFVGKSAAAA